MGGPSHGRERVRHEAPRADTRRGRSYDLHNAFGRPPKAILGGVGTISGRFQVEQGSKLKILGENLIYPF